MSSLTLTTFLTMLLGIAALAQSPTASVRDGLKATAQTQSKQVAVSPEVDIRIAHPEYNAIGRVEFETPEGTSFGTGVLINECLVLTNRHAVPDLQQKVKFRVGYTGDRNHPFAHEVEGSVVGFGGLGNSRYAQSQDWAMVRLSQSIGKKSTPGGVGSISAEFASEKRILNCPTIEIAGFPRNRTDETITIHVNCKLDQIGEGVYSFTCPVGPGESGSPVLCRFQDGSLKVIALVRRSIGDEKAGAVDLRSDKEAIVEVIRKYWNSCE